MTLELIIFIASILFGIVLYWRESNGNKFYRLFDRIINSKALQMQPDDKKGFVYQQSLLLRIVFITVFFLILIVILRFLIPIDLTTLSLFASMIVGTVLGTYLATFVFKSSEVIDEKSDSLEEVIKDTIEKGKEYIEDIKHNDHDPDEPLKEDHIETNSHNSNEDTKSARDRLKDKGLL